MRLTQAKKNKEREKKEMEANNRKHLANMRVVQKNLVYVVGLSPRLAREEFIPTLKGSDYFGEYGRVAKILISKRPPAHKIQPGHDPSVGVYVTYAQKEDAARAIVAIDGSKEPGGRVVRASYGTTKYCTSYLRNLPCANPGCTYLHEPGEEADSFTKEDLATLRHAAKDTEHKIKPASMHFSPIGRKSDTHGTEQTESALPRTASWASGRPDERDPMSPARLHARPASKPGTPGASPKPAAAVVASAQAPTSTAQPKDSNAAPSAYKLSDTAQELLDDLHERRRADAAADAVLFPDFEWTFAAFNGDFSFNLGGHANLVRDAESMRPAGLREPVYTYAGTFNPFEEAVDEWMPQYAARSHEERWPVEQPPVPTSDTERESQRSAAAALLAARARQMQESHDEEPRSRGDSKSLLALLRRIQETPRGTQSPVHAPAAPASGAAPAPVPEQLGTPVLGAHPPGLTPPPGLKSHAQEPNMATGLLLAQLLGGAPSPTMRQG